MIEGFNQPWTDWVRRSVRILGVPVVDIFTGLDYKYSVRVATMNPL